MSKSAAWRVVSFLQQTGNSDGQGGLNDSWQVISGLGNVNARISPMSASTQWQVSQLYPTANTFIEIRYRLSVNFTTAWRIKYGNHVYMIRGVMNVDQANETVRFYCEELQAKGSTRL